MGGESKEKLRVAETGKLSRIQYWTSKINNIVKEIRNINNTFKNRKNNQRNPDKDEGDEKGSKYSCDNNLIPHDRTSNHDILTHHGQLPNHNDPDIYPIYQPPHPSHSYPDTDESEIEPTSSYGFPSSMACTADIVKPSSSPSDPSSLMKGPYDPSEEGVIGSSGGGELEDPDDDEETITPLMTLSHVGIGDEEREERGEQLGEGRTGEAPPPIRSAQ